MMTALLKAADIPPLSERMLVAIVGPLVSALVGTGVIGWLLWRLSQKAEDRRRDAETMRTAAEKDLERDRARNDRESELRHELMTPLLTAAAELYVATQHFWRVTNNGDLSEEQKRDERKLLDAQYHRSRSTGSVVEAKLEALFETDQPAVTWHKVDDLLTVRYMQLVGRATDALYKQNERGYQGKEHSGLSAADLKNPATLLRAYHTAVRNVAPSILGAPLRRPGSDVDSTDNREPT